MCPRNRGVELGMLGRYVAVLALRVVDLNQIDVIFSRIEVDIVMTRAADYAAGVGLPVVGLSGTGGVAGGAITNILRKYDGRIVLQSSAVNHVVFGPSDDRGQVRSHGGGSPTRH